MKIGIFGMGYVGVVSAACLAEEGHDIVGIDKVQQKVDDLLAGKSPIQEPGISSLLEKAYNSGKLSASMNSIDGIEDMDMIWICVGTPSDHNGSIDLLFVERVIGEIGMTLRNIKSRPLIVLRSTVLPGTVNDVIIPLLEKESGLDIGKDIHIVFHPEFLRESSAINDFFDPPKIVVGELTKGSSKPLLDLYNKYKAIKFVLSLTESEMVKYADNLFHALKTTFANEIGIVSKSLGIDARRVAEVYKADTKLNISTKYLDPGFAFGGSCLPKDLRAILHLATQKSIKIPMIEGIMDSNFHQISSFANRIVRLNLKKIGMYGLSFKPKTDDMRESPYVAVAKILIGEGVKLKIYDPGIDLEKLIGSNKEAVRKALGHLEDYLDTSVDCLKESEIIIINHSTLDAETVNKWLDAGIKVFDLAGVEHVKKHINYEGIAW